MSRPKFIVTLRECEIEAEATAARAAQPATRIGTKAEREKLETRLKVAQVDLEALVMWWAAAPTRGCHHFLKLDGHARLEVGLPRPF